jgi:hypothetical protein
MSNLHAVNEHNFTFAEVFHIIVTEFKSEAEIEETSDESTPTQRIQTHRPDHPAAISCTDP